MTQYKKIIIAIIASIIIIVGLIIGILVNRTQGRIKDYNPEGEGITIDKNIISVKSHTIFYTVQNAIQKFLSFTHLDINEVADEFLNQGDTLAEQYGIHSETEKRKAIIKLLDTDYIKENNINIENVDEYIDITINKIINCNVKEMYTIENEPIQQFSMAVEFLVNNNNREETRIEYFVISLDTYNGTFMVKPIEKDELNIIEETEGQIELNDRNSYEYIRLNDSEIAKEYFNEYKEILINNTEEAFNKLDEEYRKIRFLNDINQFKKFVNENIEEINKTVIEKYTVEKYDDYNEYICMDNYKNIYNFSAESVKDYTVKLDTYTILTEKFKTSYDSSSEEEKIQLNIDKWINMLNNRDYTAAYKVLDETFAKNNFGSEERFKQYIKETLPLHYEVQFGSQSAQGETIIQEVILTDITGENELEISITVVMKLKKDYDFVMSFSL